jgi:predicted outer membrane lipoprotein
MVKRRWLRWLLGLALLAACAVPAALWLVPQVVYARQRDAGRELLMAQLYGRRPPNVSPDEWDVAAGWAITAYGNVCFSPEHTPLKELKQFCAELEERLHGPVDFKTIDWIWERLGRTGQVGQHYRQSYETQYQEGLKAVRDRLREGSADRK